MRSALPDITSRGTEASDAHPGLLYERYVPLVYTDTDLQQELRDKPREIGTVQPRVREQILSAVSRIPVSPLYRLAWRRWQIALEESGAATAVVEARSRILIGHGNPAPTEVGITLHQVYGVPILPGTGLKGLLNHYLAIWGYDMDSGWKGASYDEQGQPTGPPGDYHGALFGVPNLPGRDGRKQEGLIGGVVFEDAWLIPSADDRPLCLDILAPHQGVYYREFGQAGPNDWADPMPVSFLTVKPGTCFLLAISPLDAGMEGAELAMAHLLDALEEWGIGAKTRAGYGRLRRLVEGDAKAATGDQAAVHRPMAAVARPTSKAIESLEAVVAAVVNPQDRDMAPPIAQRLDNHITDALLDALTPDEYPTARALLKKILDHAGLRKRRGARLEEILKKVTQ